MLSKFKRKMWPRGNVATSSEADFSICAFTYEEDRPLFVDAFEKYLDRGDEFIAKGVGLHASSKIHVDLHGNWEKDSKGRVCFSVTSFEEKYAKNKEGIIAYLSCGIFRGVSETIAEGIYNVYGKNSINIIENAPEKLLLVPGIGEKKLESLIASYKEYKGPRTAIALLTPIGLNPKQAISAYERFGSKLEDTFKKHPYFLCLADKINFPVLDPLISTPENALSDDRIAAALLYVLDANEGVNAYNARLFTETGNTCVEVSTWLSLGLSVLNEKLISNKKMVEVAKNMAKSNLVAIFKIKDTFFVSRKSTALAEREIATSIKALLGATKIFSEKAVDKEIAAMEKKMGFELADEQKDAIKMALLNNFSVITGGPGSGKTTIINFVREIYNNLVPHAKILLCAPTGMAASRMTSATGYSAQTIHSALGLTPEKGDKSISIAKNSLPWDLIIVDEVSMLDVFIARALLSAIKVGTKVVFVGDAHQLPSIGAGAVLHDLIYSNSVPVTILKKIFRQAEESLILTNSHDMCENNFSCKEGEDFKVVQSSSINESSDIMLDLFLKYCAEKGVANVTMLSPFRQKTTATGVISLNRKVHDKINPPSSDKTEINLNDNLFRVGDKVIQTKNSAFVANGDIGYITAISPAKDPMNAVFTIDFGETRIVEYYGREMDKIELAYATTVHKSQGSEYDTVILNIQKEHAILLRRNLIYTAITRAKKNIVIVGDKFVMINTAKSHGVKRKTVLAYWLSCIK